MNDEAVFDLGLDADQQALEELFAGFFEKESPPEIVRRAEPMGFDAGLWGRLCALGAGGMAVPDSGQGGGRFSDLVVACEALGRCVAPVPLVEHLVGSRIVQSDDVLDGSRIVTLALQPASDEGLWRLVPAGAVAHTVVGLSGSELIAVTSEPPGKSPRNHASTPIADRSALAGKRVVLGGAADFERARDEWKVLTAAALVGVSLAAQELALAYVMERKAFGRPIGAYQALQHGLADFPALVDGARMLVHKAAWAMDGGRGGEIDIWNYEIEDPEALASMSFCFAAEAAACTTERSLHYHGSYGFSLEYDIQLFYRRAHGWPLLLGDPARERQRLADILWPLEAD